MKTGISLNQYQFKSSAKEKNKKSSYKSSEKEKSFAEKMRTVKGKKNDRSNPSADSNKRDKELERIEEELVEVISAQLKQFDLNREENQKLKRILKEAVFEQVQKTVLNDSNNGGKTAADNLTSIMNRTDLTKLFDELSSLLSSNRSEELKNSQENQVLKSLLKNIEEAEIEKINKQPLAESSSKSLILKDDGRSELLEADIINKLKQNLINQKTPVKKQTETIELKVNTQTAVNLEEIQKLETEQESDFKNGLFAEAMNFDAEKSNRELKILDSFNKSNSLEFKSEVFADLFKKDLAEAKKVSAFKFSGTDSFFNFEFENTGREINNLNNSSAFKKYIPVKDQLVEKFKGEYSAAKKEMNLELKPESLGKVEIKLRLEQGKLTAKMIVDNKIVQSQLKNSLQDLKSDLLKQGINIEQFKIETADNSPREVKNQADFNFNQQEQSFSDGEKGNNSEYQQRKFFKGQYYPKFSDKSVVQDYEHQLFEQKSFLNRGRMDSLSLNFLV